MALSTRDVVDVDDPGLPFALLGLGGFKGVIRLLGAQIVAVMSLERESSANELELEVLLLLSNTPIIVVVVVSVLLLLVVVVGVEETTYAVAAT